MLRTAPTPINNAAIPAAAVFIGAAAPVNTIELVLGPPLVPLYPTKPPVPVAFAWPEEGMTPLEVPVALTPLPKSLSMMLRASLTIEPISL